MRRLLLFALMVAVGLALVVLLDDDPVATGGGPVTGHAGGGGPAVSVGGSEQERETRVRMGEVDFPIMRAVEVAPGKVEERVVYKVHVKEARPGNDGRFELDEPVITMLDPLSGAWRGELSARVGWALTDQPEGGDLHLRLDALHADAFTLEQDVQGRFETPGGMAHLRAERLESRGSLVTAPGPVSWWRDDLRLTGEDMTLDDDARQLDLARDAVLELLAGRGGLTGTLVAPAGLTWTLSEDDDSRGHGELRGPVTGTTSDGGRLTCDRLLIAGAEPAFSLIGHAMVERPLVWSARAAELTVADDGQGALVLVEARDDVRLEQLLPGREGWLEAVALHQVGDVLRATGPVRWRRGGVEGGGPDLTWNRATGRLECSRDVTLTGLDGALAGGRLDAQGGLALDAPPEADDLLATARGELRGPVVGTLPGGESFGCARVLFDGPGAGVSLLGPVHAASPDGSELDAGRVLLLADELGALTDLSARGDVHWSGPPADERLSLLADRLDRTGSVYAAPGRVQARQGDLQLTGTGARYDEPAGVLEIHADAVLVAERAELAGRVELDAPGGITWTLPEDRSLGAAAGHGLLRGPVTGHTADGRSLRAASVQLDGTARTLGLRGDARVALDELHWLDGESLDVDLTEGSRRIDSAGPVHFVAGTLSGSGTGLHHDEASGLVELHEDVTVRFLDDSGRQRLALACDGLLRWRAPPGADDALLEGSGEAHDDVVAVDDAGGRFHTDHLEIDGPGRRFVARGPSSLELAATTGLASLRASERLVVHRDADGGLALLEATGSVEGEHRGPGERLHFTAAGFAADRDAGALVFDGPSRIERERDGELYSLSGTDHSRLVAATDDAQRFHSVVGTGRFLFETGRFTAECDRLDWDLDADHAELVGDCRLLGPAGWVLSDLLELWPDQRRSFVPRPAIVIEDRP